MHYIIMLFAVFSNRFTKFYFKYPSYHRTFILTTKPQVTVLAVLCSLDLYKPLQMYHKKTCSVPSRKNAFNKQLAVLAKKLCYTFSLSYLTTPPLSTRRLVLPFFSSNKAAFGIRLPRCTRKRVRSSPSPSCVSSPPPPKKTDVCVSCVGVRN